LIVDKIGQIVVSKHARFALAAAGKLDINEQTGIDIAVEHLQRTAQPRGRLTPLAQSERVYLWHRSAGLSRQLGPDLLLRPEPARYRHFADDRELLCVVEPRVLQRDVRAEWACRAVRTARCNNRVAGTNRPARGRGGFDSLPEFLQEGDLVE
jgi:hypothetical protein